MPLYRCTAPADLLTDDQQASVAKAITKIHCDETTAPPTFVHVQFHDAPADQAKTIFLHGGLRAGRPPDVTNRIVERCRTDVAAIAGISPAAISMRTSETPASWIYEGGRVLPEPGEEDAWLATNV